MCLTVILYNNELVSHAQPLESQRSLHGTESKIAHLQSILAIVWTFLLYQKKVPSWALNPRVPNIHLVKCPAHISDVSHSYPLQYDQGCQITKHYSFNMAFYLNQKKIPSWYRIQYCQTPKHSCHGLTFCMQIPSHIMHSFPVPVQVLLMFSAHFQISY